MTTREEKMLEEILLYDEYKQREGFSASQLGRPSLQLRLSKEYPELKMNDLDKLLSSRIGTAFHKHAEQALDNRVDLSLEETLAEEFNGEMISGTSDVYDGVANIIYDHKTMQQWKANWIWDRTHEKHQSTIDSFKVQMSCLAWLKWKETGQTVDATKIVVWSVDYKKPYKRKDGTSKPQAPQYFVYEIPHFPPEEFEIWLANKLADIYSKEEVQCRGCPDTYVYDYCAYKEVCPVLTKSF